MKTMIHSVTSLRHRVLEGPVSLEPLRVLATASAAWGDWQIAFFVLGASHAVRLRRGEAQLTELMSCAPTPDAQPSLLEAPSLHCHLHVRLPAHGIQCRLTLLPLRWEEGDGLRESYPPESLLVRAFPDAAGGRAPVTRIGWRITAYGLTVETVHTYPEERRGVRSMSVFTRDEELA